MIDFIKKHGVEKIFFFFGLSIFLLISGIYFENYLAVLISPLPILGFFKTI